MSRRDSRVSTGARQTDALHEFEAFKKKFLLANKHITKLNSTLSVRIEELNAQISTLYVENLRLRASEIALTAQLKREREKSSKVMAEAETVSQHFVKQIAFLRQTLAIQPPDPQASKVPPPFPPRARKAPGPTYAKPNPETGSPPQPPRIARAPMVPDVVEDSEPPSDADCDKDFHSKSSSAIQSEFRQSASRPPIPPSWASASPMPLPAVPTLSSLTASRKKPKSVTTPMVRRRESGLLITREDALSAPRPPSPTVGSPLRAAMEGLPSEDIADNDDDHWDDDRDDDADDYEPPRPASITRRRKPEEKERALKSEVASASNVEKERKRKRGRVQEDEVGAAGATLGMTTSEEDAAARVAKVKGKAAVGGKGKLTDVTNAQRGTVENHDSDSRRLASTSPEVDAAPSTKSKSSTSRAFLASKLPSTDPPPAEPFHPPSSSSTDTVKSESSDQPKSSRKRDVETSLPTPRPSCSPPPLLPAVDEIDAMGGRTRRARTSVNYAEPKLNTKMRKPDPPPGQAPTKKRASTSSVPSSYSTSSALQTLPSGLLIGARAAREPAEDTPQDEEEEPPIRATIYVRTAKKFGAVARDHNDDIEDEDSDGAQADAEYVPPGVSRRKSGHPGSGVRNRKEARRRAGEGDTDLDGFGVGSWEERRHSMAV